MSGPQTFPEVAMLAEEARRTTHADWVKRYAAPVLALRALGVPGGADGPDLTARELSYQRTGVAAGAGSPVAYDGRVAFLEKRPGNPFPSFVTLGRAMNNDIVIGLGTISKLHGLFWCENGVFAYSDQQSRNGTAVNGQPLKMGERRVLNDRDGMKLGLDILATFFLPGTLWKQLQG